MFSGFTSQMLAVQIQLTSKELSWPSRFSSQARSLLCCLTYLIKCNSSNKTGLCLKAWLYTLKNICYANFVFLGFSANNKLPLPQIYFLLNVSVLAVYRYIFWINGHFGQDLHCSVNFFSAFLSSVLDINPKYMMFLTK